MTLWKVSIVNVEKVFQELVVNMATVMIPTFSSLIIKTQKIFNSYLSKFQILMIVLYLKGNVLVKPIAAQQTINAESMRETVNRTMIAKKA